MNKCIKLPSGRILDVNDIIYISQPRFKMGDKYPWYVDIIWAHRIQETLNYYNKEELDSDMNELCKYIL